MDILSLLQTLDTSTTVQKHYINDESRYQLVAVTQTQIISLMSVEVGKCCRLFCALRCDLFRLRVEFEAEAVIFKLFALVFDLV